MNSLQLLMCVCMCGCELRMTLVWCGVMVDGRLYVHIKCIKHLYLTTPFGNQKYSAHHKAGRVSRVEGARRLEQEVGKSGKKRNNRTTKGIICMNYMMR